MRHRRRCNALAIVMFCLTIGSAHYKATLGSDINFQQFPSGSYYYTFDTGLAPAQIFREESRARGGTVSGTFGYVDADGVLRIATYSAGPTGYKVRIRAHYQNRFQRFPDVIGPIPQTEAVYSAYGQRMHSFWRRN